MFTCRWDMDIIFRTSKLEKFCNSAVLRQRELGDKQAELLGRRLDDLRAADSLEDISRLPPARCHELKGDRAGQLSIDLDHPYRLLFVVANDPVPVRPEGGLDWAGVTAVKIVDIEDTHG